MMLSRSMWEAVMARQRSVEQLTLSMPEPLERDIHRAIADTLRLEIGPPGRLSRHGVVWWASDISNSASAAPGARTALGLTPGVPDLSFMFRGRMYFQEIKRLRTGIVSDEQMFFLAAARLANAECGLCWDPESCVANLDVWQIPRHKRVKFAP